jgi:hypothetical protein
MKLTRPKPHGQTNPKGMGEEDLIHKNGKVGDVEGVTICVFGSGDIDVSTSDYADGSGTALMFTNMKKPVMPIGTDLVGNYGKSTNELGVDVVLEFHKIESIDVVIDALERMKGRMVEHMK